MGNNYHIVQYGFIVGHCVNILKFILFIVNVVSTLG